MRHTALLGLPDELRAYGLNVVAMDGWEEAQGRYRWTTEDGSKSYDNNPSCVLFHGTAGTVSRPVVRTRLGRWSVANAWVGLDNGNGTLTTRPVVGSINRPTIYLTAAGPARYSAGRGYWSVMEQTFNDIRPPLDAQGSTFPWKYANRYAFSVENTHPNDGSLIDADVFDHHVGLGVVLHDMSQAWDDPWTERTLGHRTWTRRKPVDPWFTPGGLVALQDDIQAELGGSMSYERFRADEFDLWTDTNVVEAYDRARFQDPNRNGFIAYWTYEYSVDANGDYQAPKTDGNQTGGRSSRTVAEKARLMTDFYSHGAP